jgi:pimeloyl-ACP methyl ester carboxylesterase
MAQTALERRTIELHGHPVSYRLGGSGPLLVLIHGITSSSRTWERVLPALADHFTVLAPDLLGHGESAKPRGDYSLGAYASGIRDLMVALGHPRATVVGHSLGGGIAMQLAYQFPERVERLVLVNSGGLGREVNLMLRAATLPGSEYVLPLLCAPALADAVRAVGRVMGAIGLRPGADLTGMLEGFASLSAVDARRAFLHTARSIIDIGGQRVSARDRLYLASGMPTLIVWGENDPMIPVAHGRAAHAEMPGSRLEVFPDAGHFPFNDDPLRFARVLREFLDTTEPALHDEEHVRRLLLDGHSPSSTVKAPTRASSPGGRANRRTSRAKDPAAAR